MRKAEAASKIAALQREVSALKAHIARLTAPPVVKPVVAPIAQPVTPIYAKQAAPVPKPPEQVAITSPVKKPVGRPKGKAKTAAKAKTAKDAKEGNSESNIYAVAGVANPLAAMTLAQIAEEYGSSGYDDLETPIEDHDRNWASHPRNKTGKWTPGD